MSQDLIVDSEGHKYSGTLIEITDTHIHFQLQGRTTPNIISLGSVKRVILADGRIAYEDGKVYVAEPEPVKTEVAAALSVYQNQAYYLAKERRLFSGVYYKARNLQGEFTVARPGFVSLRVQEEFFQDSPKAVHQIGLFKKATRNQMIALGAFLLLYNPSYANTILPFTGVGAFVWSGVESNRALNHLYLALHYHNFSALESRIPAETYSHFVSNCMHRSILPFGGSQVIIKNQPHDVPGFLRPAPDTYQLFAGTQGAALAYKNFQVKRRQSSQMVGYSIGVLFGSIVWSVGATTVEGIVTGLLAGYAGFVVLVIMGVQMAIEADNSLNEAVYLYNEEMLRQYP